jgi:RecA-family ATPase
MRQSKLAPNQLTLNERLDLAVEHFSWLSNRQVDGNVVVRAFASNTGPQPLKLVSTEWFHNRDPDFLQSLKRHLRHCFRKQLHTFYGVNAFEIEDAKAQHVGASRVAQVDADNVQLPPPGPVPTRIVATSPGNFQFLYELDRLLQRAEIESVSSYLTNLVRGDRGGYSSAKLFRAPGSFNVKPAYNPPPLVKVIESGGPVHSAIAMLETARSYRSSAGPSSGAKHRTLTKSVLSPAAIREKYSSRLSQDVRMRLRQARPYESFTFRIGGRELVAPKDDRSAIVFQIGTEFRDAGATPEETFSVIEDSAFWRSRETDGKHEKPDRLIDKIFAETWVSEAVEDNRLITLDPADWAGKPVPERSWLVSGIIPMRKVTGLYGDGGTGKTTLALQLAIDVALGRDFLEMPTKAGRVFAFLGEDEELDTHISLAALCEHYGIGLEELRGRMLVAPRAAADNVLMTFDGSHPKVTPLFEELLRTLKLLAPVVIIVDTAADTFGGNENIRAEVRAFVANCCGRLARETGAAVVLLAHPSQTGIASKRGDGGSTAWSNSMRSRLSLSYDDDGDADNRILELKKTNHSRTGSSFKLRWHNGAFVVGDSAKQPRSLTPGEVDIIAEVERSFRMGDPLSAHHQAGHRWLGYWMMDNLKFKRARAKTTVERLLRMRKIVEIDYNPHLHRKALCTPTQFSEFKRAKESR